MAAAYAPWLRALVVDTRDDALRPSLAARGIRAIVADTIMTDRASELALARVVVEA